MEIAPGVFLIGAPLAPAIPAFSFIKIRNAHDEDISTWTCHIPRTGKENPRVPHDIADQSTYGWIICNGQEVLLKNGDEEYCYIANPPPIRKIEKGSLGVKRRGKVKFLSLDIVQTVEIFNRNIARNCVEKHRKPFRRLYENMAANFPLMRCVSQTLPLTSANYLAGNTTISGRMIWMGRSDVVMLYKCRACKDRGHGKIKLYVGLSLICRCSDATDIYSVNHTCHWSIMRLRNFR